MDSKLLLTVLLIGAVALVNGRELKESAALVAGAAGAQAGMDTRPLPPLAHSRTVLQDDGSGSTVTSVNVTPGLSTPNFQGATETITTSNGDTSTVQCSTWRGFQTTCNGKKK